MRLFIIEGSTSFGRGETMVIAASDVAQAVNLFLEHTGRSIGRKGWHWHSSGCVPCRSDDPPAPINWELFAALNEEASAVSREMCACPVLPEGGRAYPPGMFVPRYMNDDGDEMVITEIDKAEAGVLWSQ